jgi:hypothetical protein
LSYPNKKMLIYKEVEGDDAAVKSVKEGVIHGMGVRFGDETTKDSYGEWFSEKSQVGLQNGTSRPFLMGHGWTDIFGKAVVAWAVYEKTAKGWEYEATFLPTDIANKAYNEVISHPYRSSAGAAGHTRQATMVKDSFHLDTWLIGEQSATLTPADAQNDRIVRIKSSEDAVWAFLGDMQKGQVAFMEKVFDVVKGINEQREHLANVMEQLKDSFKDESKKQFAPTDEFLAELERVTAPIEIR